jgi:FkbM family methyltransferase
MIRTMFRKLYQNALNHIHAGRLIRQAGGTASSVLLYPLRRRSAVDPRCAITFRNGVTISAPKDLPLLNLIEEIQIRDSYRIKESRLNAGATVVDIGANVGVFTILLAAAHPGARVIAVEPGHDNCTFLSRNVAANRLTNVAIARVACGGRKGEGTLYTRGQGVHHSLFNRNMLGTKFTPFSMTPIWPLQDIFDEFKVLTCDLLKLDCEGAEYDILFCSSPSTLQRIRRISMEYHVGFNNHSVAELEQFLIHHGFLVNRTCYNEEGTGMLHATNQATTTDSMFVDNLAHSRSGLA